MRASGPAALPGPIRLPLRCLSRVFRGQAYMFHLVRPHATVRKAPCLCEPSARSQNGDACSSDSPVVFRQARSMRPRLLVVEDDGLQQAVLKSALEGRGYDVEVASDGLTAVRKLRAGGFDLALIDYHMPEIDGFASARLLRDLMPGEDRPKLIAVTAASDSLITRDASESVFDAIVPKPLNLPALLTIVDTHLRATGHAAHAAEAAWREFGLTNSPAVVAVPHPTPAQAQVLRCYFDLTGQREPEAVLLLGLEASDDAVAMRTHSPHFTLPFLDLTGRHADADAVFSAADRSTWGAVAAVITRFGEGRRLLARTAMQAIDLDTRLLAYLSLSGRQFQPSTDFSSRECVRYPGFFPDSEVRSAAERLANRGLLDRRFHERFHACGRCGSSRLNAREECPACHSAQLLEVTLVHHFRCAYQAPEVDFIRGPHLVCPKCRQQLRHYGSDYDKPGIVTKCCGCGVISPEPDVGFACLDCGAHTKGDAATKRDVFSYALTAEGTAALRRGTARLSVDVPLISSELPIAVREALARLGPPAALVELRYGARGRILARRGETGFAAMRRLFLENLVNALDGDCMVIPGVESDHLLIRTAPPAALAELGPALLEACQEVLAEGLEPEMRLLQLSPAMASIR